MDQGNDIGSDPYGHDDGHDDGSDNGHGGHHRDGENPQAPPSPAFLALMAAILAPFGIALLAQGLGYATMERMRPNPHTPGWMFALIGTFLLTAALGCVLEALKMPEKLTQSVGVLIAVISLALMTGMAFGVEGGQMSCMIGPIPLFGEFGHAICRGLFRTIAVLVDILLLPLLLVWLAKTLFKRN
jgi:hypothetical protein